MGKQGKNRSNCMPKKESKKVQDRKKERKTNEDKRRINKTNLIRTKKSIPQKKKPTYSSRAVELALETIASGVSIRKAADTFGVPATTLFRKRKYPRLLDCKFGPPTVLSKEEEKEIVKWILYRAQTGSPVTKTELLDSVALYIKSLDKKTTFTNDRPGRHWYEGFCKRNPNLSIRTAQNLTFVRAAVTEEDLRSWFNDIEVYLQSKDLLNIEPCRIFNCDETNIQLCPKPEKVLVQKGAKSVYKVVDANENKSVTALFMYSPSGVRGPPMVIYKYKEHIPKKVLENFPSDWGIGISESGWMTTEIFYEYFTNVFYKWLVQKNISFPIVVYMDGHSSHFTLPLIQFCKQRNIELISLYPHATHIIQPLDVALFHPFKETWKKIVPQWKAQNNIMRLTKEQFPAVLQLALNVLQNEHEIVINGFKACGLVPFNPNAVEYNVLNKRKKNDVQNKEQENQASIINHQQTSTTLSEDKNQFLDAFEKSLDSELLQQFRSGEENQVWDGCIEQKGLYEYWLSIRKTIHDESLLQENTNPKIKSVEKLINRVIVVPQLTNKQSDCFQENLCNQSQNNYDVVEVALPVLNANELIQPANQIIELSHASDSSLKESALDFERNIEIEDKATLQISEDSVILDISKFNITNSTTGLSEELDTLSIVPNTTADIQTEINQSEFSLTTVEIPSNNYLINNVDPINDENNMSLLNNDSELSKATTFNEVFTLPEELLPTKEKVKLQKTGKRKSVKANTLDAWYEVEMTKHNAKRLPEEKKEKKRLLQQEKKQIAEEKKKLDEKIKEINMKIKKEKV